jgi:hypothetical protein
LIFLLIFPKDTVKIYEEIRDPKECGVDSYGKPRKCRVFRGRMEGDLQSATAREIRNAFGTTEQGDYILYLNTSEQIKNTFLLKVEGYTGFFEVLGTPKIYNKFIPHLEVLLKHRREE